MQMTDIQVDWEKIRSCFNLNSEMVQLGASQFISSHPLPVRQAILQYSQKLDESPVLYTMEQENKKMQECREEIAHYFGIQNPDAIALTDSTTMGLGTIYTGLNWPRRRDINYNSRSLFSARVYTSGV
jgi:isopenicillin-N epimerase